MDGKKHFNGAFHVNFIKINTDTDIFFIKNSDKEATTEMPVINFNTSLVEVVSINESYSAYSSVKTYMADSD